ncbi:DNA-binding protein [uncultured Shewanella sp.]|uniref:DNA-binding protein n=1 Tax=uncultured Shewanella sp. TaxID=173975 RepID=UPI0026237A71|nr:DNA-binding protein [uncultured Shewanella sp.]
MNHNWFTPSELLGKPHMPNTVQGVRYKASKENWKSRQRQGKGGGKEYYIESLPAETQSFMIVNCTNDINLETNVSIAHLVQKDGAIREQERKNAFAAKTTAMQRFMGLSESVQNKAKAKEKVVQALGSYLIPYEAAGNKKLGIEAFINAFNHNELSSVAEIYPIISKVTRPVLYRWQAAYKKEGIMGLVDKRKSPNTNKIDTQHRLNEFINALITAKPHLLNQPKKVREMALVKAAEFNWELPSIGSFKRWLAQYAAKNEVALAYITNPTQYTDKYRPLFSTMYPQVDGPNQVWEFDSTPTDVELNVDGKLKRHCIVAAIDVYTRRVQLIVSPASHSEAICLLLRKCLLEWGIPEEGAIMRTDNGSDYVSKRTTTIFEMLELKQSRAAAFSGWEKPFIERFFGTMSRVLMEKMPGYIGHSVNDRQQIEAMHTFAMRIGDGKKQVQAERLGLALTPHQLQEALNNYLEFDYNHVPHDKSKKTPFELYAESGYKKRAITNEHVLDYLLNYIGTSTVARGGVRAGNVRYTAPELMEVAWQRKKVRVFVDPNDIGRATLYPIEGFETYVEAVNHELVNNGISPVLYRERRKQAQKDLAVMRKTAKKLQEEFGINNLYADELAQKKALNDSLRHIERPVEHNNASIKGLEAGSQRRQDSLSANELAMIERQRLEMAERKQRAAKHESHIVRTDHEKAMMLTKESLNRTLTQTEEKWLKQYRLNNVLQRSRLDRVLKSADSAHRQVR